MLAPLLLGGCIALAPGRAAPPGPTAPRVDALGDPLPPGALLRLGTARLWHDSIVTGLAFSPDGKVLASGSDKTVRLSDPTTGKELRRMTAGHEIVGIAFAPGGKRLAASTNGGAEVLLWDPRTGKEVRRFRGPAPPAERVGFTALAFSPGGKVLGWGGWDGTLRFSDVAGGREIGKASLGQRAWVCTAAFSPDGKVVAVGGRGPTGGGALQLREVPSGKEVRAFPRQAGVVYAVAFSPDGKLLASAGGSEDVHLWDPATGKQVRRLRGHNSEIYSLAFSPDGKILASADLSRRQGGSGTRTWEVATGKEVLAIPCGRKVAFSPDGKTLAAVDGLDTIRLFDPATGKDRLPLRRHDSAVLSVAFSADRKAVVTNDGLTLRVWDPATGRLPRQTKGEDYRIEGFAQSADGKTLAVIYGDYTIRYHETATGKETGSFRPDVCGPALALSPDGKLLAVGGERVRFWRAGTAREVGRIEQVARSVVFSPDGKILAGGLPSVPYADGRKEPGTVCLWDVSTGRPRFRLNEDGEVLAFSPDGRILVSTDGRKLYGWETATGTEFFTIAAGARSDRVRVLAFSPEGGLLATAGWGGMVRLWDVATGKSVASLRGHADGVCSLAFSSDGRVLASGSFDTTVLFWDVADKMPPLPAKDLKAADRERLWRDLGGTDGPGAWRAIQGLAAGRQRTVGWLKGRLGPAKGVGGARLRRLIADLDSEQFGVREAATAALKALGAEARPALEEALRASPSPEARKRMEKVLAALEGPPPSRDVLRGVRAIAVLEQIGTREARHVLERLATGAAGSRVTQEARESLRRLGRRTPSSSR